LQAKLKQSTEYYFKTKILKRVCCLSLRFTVSWVKQVPGEVLGCNTTVNSSRFWNYLHYVL